MTLKCKNPPCANVRRKGFPLCFNCWSLTSNETRHDYVVEYNMWLNAKTDENLTRLLVAFQSLLMSIK